MSASILISFVRTKSRDSIDLSPTGMARFRGTLLLVSLLVMVMLVVEEEKEEVKTLSLAEEVAVEEEAKLLGSREVVVE